MDIPVILRRILEQAQHGEAAVAAHIVSVLTPSSSQSSQESTSTATTIMDDLGQEVCNVFKFCALAEFDEESLDESSDPDGVQRRFGEYMMCCITKIHDVLTKVRNNNNGDDTLLKRYHDAIITPVNLKMLFYMCDARSRTGEIRCRALGLLVVFVSGQSSSPPSPLWSMKIPSFYENYEFTVPFAIKAITVMSKVLTQKGHCRYNNNNNSNPQQGECPSQCFIAPWIIMANATGKVLKTEPLDELLMDLYCDIDWPTLFQVENDTGNDTTTHYGYRSMMEHPTGIQFFNVQTFCNLHAWACGVLKKNDDPSNSTTAKIFLRTKLGCCHDLLLQCLRRIVTGKIHAASADADADDDEDDARHNRRHGNNTCSRSLLLLNDMRLVGCFLSQFMNCLVPVPADRETKALVRRARIALINTIVVDILPYCFDDEADADVRLQIHTLDRYTLVDLGRWQELHDESDQERWNRFHVKFVDCPTMTSDESLVKRLRNEHEKAQQSEAARTPSKNSSTIGEMCANCFVSETAFRKECFESLMSCSRCRQSMYCSRECQRTHWKRHKKQCKKTEKVTTTHAGESSKSSS